MTQAGLPLVFAVRREHDLLITLSDGRDGKTTSCVIETTFEPPRKAVEAFEALATGRLPPKHLPREEWRHAYDFIDEDGNLLENHAVPLYLMPQSFQEFARRLWLEMTSAARDAVGVLRWRTRTLGPRQPISSLGITWTIDTTTWRPMPFEGTIIVHDLARLYLTDSTVGEVQSLLDAGELEPLAHALFREAWGQRHDNPRSSLLIGMAAVEIGIKN